MAEIPLNKIKKIVCSAGRAVLKYYHQEYTIRDKGGQAWVTEADLAAEEILQKELQQFGWPVLSEESESTLPQDCSCFWVVDPLDGTADFIAKTGEFSIMVGLVKDQRPVLGLVYLPAQDKLYFAEKGKGAYLLESGQPPQRLRVSSQTDLNRARLVVSRTHFSEQDQNFARQLKVKSIKEVGSNGVKIGLIAEGKADLFFNSTDKMGVWDSCGPQIILEEAGGKMTDIQGHQLTYRPEESRLRSGLAASNGKLHCQLLSVFQD